MPDYLLSAIKKKVARPQSRASYYPTMDTSSMYPTTPMPTGGTPPPNPPHATEDPWTGRGGRNPGDYGGANAGAAQGNMDKFGGGAVPGVPGGSGATGYTPPPAGYVPTPSGGSAGTEVPTVGDTGQGTDQLSSGQYLDDFLAGIMTGEGQSFDPIREGMLAQEDAARRRMAEMYASRGMGQSGALAGGLGDITRDFARQIAEKQMQWRQQQIQNKFSAAEMLFKDRWQNLAFDQQKALAELMFELDRKAKYGEDYNSNLGDYELQILRDLMTSDSLDESGKRIVQRLLNDLGYGGYLY